MDYIVNDWTNCHYNGNVEVSKTIESRNFSNEYIGNIISFTEDDFPAGYIVLSAKESEHPIIEFSFEGDCIYNYIEQRIEEKNQIALSDEKNISETTIYKCVVSEQGVLYTDFTNYSMKIKLDNKDYLFDQYQRIKTFNIKESA